MFSCTHIPALSIHFSEATMWESLNKLSWHWLSCVSVPWLIITGSGLDDLIYWRLLYNYNQYNSSQTMTVWLDPILTGLRVPSLPLWLTWFWFTNRSLQLPFSAGEHSTAEQLTQLSSTTEMNSWTAFWILLRLNVESISPSPSHIATDGLSVSKSWCRAPSGAHDHYCWILRFCFLWGALSDERTGLSFIYSAGPYQRSLSYDSQGHGRGIRPHLHTGSSTSANYEDNSSARITQKTQPLLFRRRVCCAAA
jgi:hypothetical protein